MTHRVDPTSEAPHPLPLEKAGNPKRVSEAQPISPPLAPQDLTLPPALTLPGTTNSQPYPTLHSPWRDRLRAKLRQKVVYQEGVRLDITPYLERAEYRAEVCIGEILQTAGACGPIAATQAVLGAKFAELAEYFIDHADPTSKTGRSDILLARACADTSRLNLDGALKTAHAIANARPPAKTDPLEAFRTPDVVEEEPEPT